MVVVSPQIKFMEFIPGVGSSLSTKEVFFHDAPGGMSWSRIHLNPVNARRTQDGSLITQTIRYNKKDISVNIGYFDVTFGQYFQALYEEGIRFTLKIWVENPTTFVEETEFNATVQMLSFSDDTDQSGNSRTLNMTLAEA
jgi:hypothetical protein